MIWVLGVGLLIGIFVGGFLVFYLSNWQEVARVNDEAFGGVIRLNLRRVLNEYQESDATDEEIRKFDIETVRLATAEILERLTKIESEIADLTSNPAPEPASDLKPKSGEINQVNSRFMDLTEFRDAGYLQEVNRRFFHPLGLSMAMQTTNIAGKRITCLVGIQDIRDDPEGVYFLSHKIGTNESRRKADRISEEFSARSMKRISRYGSVVQPFPTSD